MKTKGTRKYVMAKRERLKTNKSTYFETQRKQSQEFLRTSYFHIVNV